MLSTVHNLSADSINSIRQCFLVNGFKTLSTVHKLSTELINSIRQFVDSLKNCHGTISNSRKEGNKLEFRNMESTSRSAEVIRPGFLVTVRDVWRHDVAGACFGFNLDSYRGKCPNTE